MRPNHTSTKGKRQSSRSRQHTQDSRRDRASTHQQLQHQDALKLWTWIPVDGHIHGTCRDRGCSSAATPSRSNIFDCNLLSVATGASSSRHCEIRLSLTKTLWRQQRATKATGSVQCAPHSFGVDSLPHWLHREAAMMPPTASQRRPIGFAHRVSLRGRRCRRSFRKPSKLRNPCPPSREYTLSLLNMFPFKYPVSPNFSRVAERNVVQAVGLC